MKSIDEHIEEIHDAQKKVLGSEDRTTEDSAAAFSEIFDACGISFLNEEAENIKDHSLSFAISVLEQAMMHDKNPLEAIRGAWIQGVVLGARMGSEWGERRARSEVEIQAGQMEE